VNQEPKGGEVSGERPEGGGERMRGGDVADTTQQMKLIESLRRRHEAKVKKRRLNSESGWNTSNWGKTLEVWKKRLQRPWCKQNFLWALTVGES